MYRMLVYFEPRVCGERGRSKASVENVDKARQALRSATNVWACWFSLLVLCPLREDTVCLCS